METPTVEEIRRCFTYDPATGALRWARPSANGTRRAGDLAGARQRDGLRVGLNGRLHWAHRLVWLHVNGRAPIGVIDHINGDPFDNRLENLREVDKSINAQNQKRAHRDNTSGYLGVSRVMKTGRWLASIMLDGRVRRLGTHDTPAQAHAAYLAAKRELHLGNTL